METEIKRKVALYQKEGRKMFLFVLINLLVLLFISVLGYVLGFETFNEVEAYFKPTPEEYMILFGLLILGAEFILALIFFYLPWCRRDVLREEFPKNSSEPRKKSRAYLWFFIVIIIIFLLILIFQEKLGFFEFILFWIIFFLASLITHLALYYWDY